MAANRLCEIEGCGKKHYGRGWCRRHYVRWRDHGHPLGGGPARGEPYLFLKQTALSYDGDECLIWPYGKLGAGYAIINLYGKSRRVARMVCEAEHGPPPTDRHEAAHSCGNGHLGCVAKRHLRWATPKENIADKVLHGTQTMGESQYQAKLTEHQVRRIRELAGTVKQKDMAKAFGVTRTAISAIVTRRTWAFLE